jgi:uncharacterized protein YlxW (UPF0749 family)
MASSITSGLDDMHLDSNSSTQQDDDLSSMTSMNPDPEARSAELKTTIDDLVQRCQQLCQEVDTYAAAVDTNQKLAKISNPVEYRSLRNDFKNELNFLRKIVGSDLSEEKARYDRP